MIHMGNAHRGLLGRSVPCFWDRYKGFAHACVHHAEVA